MKDPDCYMLVCRGMVQWHQPQDGQPPGPIVCTDADLLRDFARHLRNVNGGPLSVAKIGSMAGESLRSFLNGAAAGGATRVYRLMVQDGRFGFGIFEME
jgi:hypothetical protein